MDFYEVERTISVRFEYDNSVAGLARSYNDRLGKDGVLQSHVHADALGRHLEMSFSADILNRKRFEIDGPGGEYITGVEMIYKDYDNRVDDDASSLVMGEEEENYEQLEFLTFKVNPRGTTLLAPHSAATAVSKQREYKRALCC